MYADAEFRLFCLALRRPQSAADGDDLRRLIAAGPDWNAVIAGAQYHNVAPLLVAGLRGCDVPPPVIDQLHRLAIDAGRRGLVQSRIIAELSGLFAAAGIRLLVIKGVALSLQLYGDPGQRRARDIDLLVDPADFAAAAALLREAGYRHSLPVLSPRQDTSHRYWTKDVEFRHPGTGMSVELHHRLCDNPELLAWDFATLWCEREEIEIGGATVATLARRRLPFYLCIHAAGHAWERLCWLADFTAATRLHGSDTALGTAQQAGLAAPLLQALRLAHEWLALPVAAEHLAAAQADRRAARLDRILARFYATGRWHRPVRRGTPAALRRYSLWQRLYRLSLKPGGRYVIRQALREYVSPADWSTVRLPDILFWLYPFVRPAGWMIRRWRRGARAI